MIEAGGELYNLISVVFMVFISFLIGTQVGYVSKNGQKNTD